DDLPTTLRFLINNWPVLTKLAARQAYDQIAARVQTHLPCFGKVELDAARVCAGSHHEVVLKLALVAVVDEVNARINFAVLYLRVVSHTCAPGLRFVTDEVTTPARQFFNSSHARCWISAFQPYS